MPLPIRFNTDRLPVLVPVRKWMTVLDRLPASADSFIQPKEASEQCHDHRYRHQKCICVGLDCRHAVSVPSGTEVLLCGTRFDAQRAYRTEFLEGLPYLSTVIWSAAMSSGLPCTRIALLQASASSLVPVRWQYKGLLRSIRIQTNLTPSCVETRNLTALNGLFPGFAHQFI
jgi:hypothetical protein